MAIRYVYDYDNSLDEGLPHDLGSTALKLHRGRPWTRYTNTGMDGYISMMVYAILTIYIQARVTVCRGLSCC